MRFRMLAAGTRMPAWVNEGVTDYAQRMPRECALEITEIPLGRRTKSGQSKQAMDDEADRMLAVPRPGDLLIALEVNGKQLDSAALAQRMSQWFAQGGDVNLLIGGPDGLAPACRERADFEWSLSKLTLPHGLVRVLVAEQLYRAYSILRNHPYHRA